MQCFGTCTLPDIGCAIREQNIARMPIGQGMVAHLALPTWAVPSACSRNPNQATRPPLQEVVLLLQVRDHFAPGNGRYHFCQHVLEGINLQPPIGEQSLEPGIFLFQFAQARRGTHGHAAVRFVPCVEVFSAMPCVQHTTAIVCSPVSAYRSTTRF